MARFNYIFIFINHAAAEGFFFSWEGQNLRAFDIDLVAHRKASIQKAHFCFLLREKCPRCMRLKKIVAATPDSSLSVLGKIVS